MQFIYIIALTLSITTAGAQNFTGISFCPDNIGTGAYYAHKGKTIMYGAGVNAGQYNIKLNGQVLTIPKHLKVSAVGGYVYKNQYVAACISYNYFVIENELPGWFNTKALKPLSAGIEIGAVFNRLLLAVNFDCIQWSPQFKAGFSF